MGSPPRESHIPSLFIDSVSKVEPDQGLVSIAVISGKRVLRCVLRADDAMRAHMQLADALGVSRREHDA